MSPSRGNKGFPRLAHKKSRTGCARCRTRRVKCDEVHPVCGGCERHQVSCQYNNESPSSQTNGPQTTKSAKERSIKSSVPSSIGKNKDDGELTETKDRRMLELRLLHHYITKTSLHYLNDKADTPAVRATWTMFCSDLCFKHEALLYSILALSALHMIRTESTDLGLLCAYRKYLDLGLRAHQKEVQTLNRETADATCMTSNVLRILGLAMLSERPISPYKPPLQWLQMTNGAGRVLHTCWKWIKNDQNSVAMAMLRRSPMLTPFNESLFCESNRKCLLPLLRHNGTDDGNEPWDADILNAYAVTLSYIGGVILAIRSGEETVQDIGRWLVAFPVLIPMHFIELVTEEQPRALVILAYYFAIMAKRKDIWYVGNAGDREVRGIMRILPEKWQHWMEWPLQVIQEDHQSIKEPALF